MELLLATEQTRKFESIAQISKVFRFSDGKYLSMLSVSKFLWSILYEVSAHSPDRLDRQDIQADAEAERVIGAPGVAAEQPGYDVGRGQEGRNPARQPRGVCAVPGATGGARRAGQRVPRPALLPAFALVMITYSRPMYR